MLRDCKGIGYAWLAFIISFLAIPLMILIVQGGQLYVAGAEMQKAADAAALAAVQPHCIDLGALRQTGQIVLTPLAYYEAMAWANMNADYFRARGFTVDCYRIRVDNARKTVSVTCRAVLPGLLGISTAVERTGTARVRLY